MGRERCDGKGAIEKNDTREANFTVTVSYGGGSMMEQGGICLGDRTELVFIENGSHTAQQYVNEVLE